MDESDDLYWHALNFRTAAPQHAHEMWLALEACVARKVAAERERCANLCEKCVDNGSRAFFLDLARRIRGITKCPGPACQGCMECDGY